MMFLINKYKYFDMNFHQIGACYIFIYEVFFYYYYYMYYNNNNINYILYILYWN